MEEKAIFETIERYIKGEMLPQERVFFEQLRKDNPAIDQRVVEHTLFLSQIDRFGHRAAFRKNLSATQDKLLRSGDLHDSGAPKVVRLWKKYRKVIAVAASIAGITALCINSLVSRLAPKADTNYVIGLSRKINLLEQKQNSLTAKINEVKAPRSAQDNPVKLGGTGFLIDGAGYLVTNAHVVDRSSAVSVQNNRGQEFNARLIYVDPSVDLAILRITDESFSPVAKIPYAISRNGAELGEPIFTLGFPRDEIVYGEGYMSAKTGFNGDTLACQIAVAANPGNSGGPVLNRNGEVIGILSTREVQAQGVVFAIKAKNIYQVIERSKNDSTFPDHSLVNLHMPQTSALRGMDRVAQIKKMEDFIFLVKSY